MAVRFGFKLRQLDIKTAYLNGEIEEQIHMELPQHFEDVLAHLIQDEKVEKDVRAEAEKMLEALSSQDMVCLLSKALYGLRQAGRAWHRRLEEELKGLKATRSDADPCLYFIGPADNRIFIIVYVDDILIMSREDAEIDKVRDFLGSRFEVKDLGEVGYCLGLEFERSEGKIKISQTGYIGEVLERFGMAECKPVSTPMEPGIKLQKVDVTNGEKLPDVPYRQLIGALMYLAVGTRPDIAFAVSHLSQFNYCYGEPHWKAAKRVLRYLGKTRDLGLMYSNSADPPEMFVDADWANCVVDRRSYTGYAFIVSGGAVSWECRKQPTVALSSTEAEYMAISDATREAIQKQRLLRDFGIKLDTVVMRNDNLGAVKLTTNELYHSRTKHIDTKHHLIRHHTEKGTIRVEHISTDEMSADVLTKGLPRVKHDKCVLGLGLTLNKPGSS